MRTKWCEYILPLLLYIEMHCRMSNRIHLKNWSRHCYWIHSGPNEVADSIRVNMYSFAHLVYKNSKTCINFQYIAHKIVFSKKKTLLLADGCSLLLAIAIPFSVLYHFESTRFTIHHSPSEHSFSLIAKYFHLSILYILLPPPLWAPSNCSKYFHFSNPSLFHFIRFWTNKGKLQVFIIISRIHFK